MKEFFPIFSLLLFWYFIWLFQFNPFWIFIIHIHDIIFHATFYINKHIGCCFWFHELLLNFHFFCIKLDWLMVSTEIIFENLLWRYLLYNLIVKLVPFSVGLDKIIVMTWLSTSSLMNKNSIKFIFLLKTLLIVWPGGKIKKLFVLKLG